ncbi:MAG: hypothetical protein KY450_13275, partial [Actinobacteria bacterium]|nr:hypothetical protein [Actinomycetota bacterium]
CARRSLVEKLKDAGSIPATSTTTDEGARSVLLSGAKLVPDLVLDDLFRRQIVVCRTGDLLLPRVRTRELHEPLGRHQELRRDRSLA